MGGAHSKALHINERQFEKLPHPRIKKEVGIKHHPLTPKSVQQSGYNWPFQTLSFPDLRSSDENSISKAYSNEDKNVSYSLSTILRDDITKPSYESQYFGQKRFRSSRSVRKISSKDYANNTMVNKPQKHPFKVKVSGPKNLYSLELVFSPKANPGETVKKNEFYVGDPLRRLENEKEIGKPFHSVFELVHRQFPIEPERTDIENDKKESEDVDNKRTSMNSFLRPKNHLDNQINNSLEAQSTNENDPEGAVNEDVDDKRTSMDSFLRPKNHLDNEINNSLEAQSSNENDPEGAVNPVNPADENIPPEPTEGLKTESPTSTVKAPLSKPDNFLRSVKKGSYSSFNNERKEQQKYVDLLNRDSSNFSMKFPASKPDPVPRPNAEIKRPYKGNAAKHSPKIPPFRKLVPSTSPYHAVQIDPVRDQKYSSPFIGHGEGEAPREQSGRQRYNRYQGQDQYALQQRKRHFNSPFQDPGDGHLEWGKYRTLVPPPIDQVVAWTPYGYGPRKYEEIDNTPVPSVDKIYFPEEQRDYIPELIYDEYTVSALGAVETKTLSPPQIEDFVKQFKEDEIALALRPPTPETDTSAYESDDDEFTDTYRIIYREFSATRVMEKLPKLGLKSTVSKYNQPPEEKVKYVFDPESDAADEETGETTEEKVQQTNISVPEPNLEPIEEEVDESYEDGLKNEENLYEEEKEDSEYGYDDGVSIKDNSLDFIFSKKLPIENICDYSETLKYEDYGDVVENEDYDDGIKEPIIVNNIEKGMTLYKKSFFYEEVAAFRDDEEEWDEDLSSGAEVFDDEQNYEDNLVEDVGYNDGSKDDVPESDENELDFDDDDDGIDVYDNKKEGQNDDTLKNNEGLIPLNEDWDDEFDADDEVDEEDIDICASESDDDQEGWGDHEFQDYNPEAFIEADADDFFDDDDEEDDNENEKKKPPKLCKFQYIYPADAENKTTRRGRELQDYYRNIVEGEEEWMGEVRGKLTESYHLLFGDNNPFMVKPPKPLWIQDFDEFIVEGAEFPEDFYEGVKSPSEGSVADELDSNMDGLLEEGETSEYGQGAKKFKWGTRLDEVEIDAGVDTDGGERKEILPRRRQWKSWRSRELDEIFPRKPQPLTWHLRDPEDPEESTSTTVTSGVGKGNVTQWKRNDQWQHYRDWLLRQGANKLSVPSKSKAQSSTSDNNSSSSIANLSNFHKENAKLDSVNESQPAQNEQRADHWQHYQAWITKQQLISGNQEHSNSAATSTETRSQNTDSTTTISKRQHPWQHRDAQFGNSSSNQIAKTSTDKPAARYFPHFIFKKPPIDKEKKETASETISDSFGGTETFKPTSDTVRLNLFEKNHKDGFPTQPKNNDIAAEQNQREILEQHWDSWLEDVIKEKGNNEDVTSNNLHTDKNLSNKPVQKNNTLAENEEPLEPINCNKNQKELPKDTPVLRSKIGFLSSKVPYTDEDDKSSCVMGIFSTSNFNGPKRPSTSQQIPTMSYSTSKAASSQIRPISYPWGGFPISYEQPQWEQQSSSMRISESSPIPNQNQMSFTLVTPTNNVDCSSKTENFKMQANNNEVTGVPKDSSQGISGDLTKDSLSFSNINNNSGGPPLISTDEKKPYEELITSHDIEKGTITTQSHHTYESCKDETPETSSATNSDNNQECTDQMVEEFGNWILNGEKENLMAKRNVSVTKKDKETLCNNFLNWMSNVEKLTHALKHPSKNINSEISSGTEPLSENKTDPPSNSGVEILSSQNTDETSNTTANPQMSDAVGTKKKLARRAAKTGSSITNTNQTSTTIETQEIRPKRKYTRRINTTPDISQDKDSLKQTSTLDEMKDSMTALKTHTENDKITNDEISKHNSKLSEIPNVPPILSTLPFEELKIPDSISKEQPQSGIHTGSKTLENTENKNILQSSTDLQNTTYVDEIETKPLGYETISSEKNGFEVKPTIFPPNSIFSPGSSKSTTLSGPNQRWFDGRFKKGVKHFNHYSSFSKTEANIDPSTSNTSTLNIKPTSAQETDGSASNDKQIDNSTSNFDSLFKKSLIDQKAQNPFAERKLRKHGDHWMHYKAWLAKKGVRKPIYRNISSASEMPPTNGNPLVQSRENSHLKERLREMSSMFKDRGDVLPMPNEKEPPSEERIKSLHQRWLVWQSKLASKMVDKLNRRLKYHENPRSVEQTTEVVKVRDFIKQRDYWREIQRWASRKAYELYNKSSPNEELFINPPVSTDFSEHTYTWSATGRRTNSVDSAIIQPEGMLEKTFTHVKPEKPIYTEWKTPEKDLFEHSPKRSTPLQNAFPELPISKASIMRVGPHLTRSQTVPPQRSRDELFSTENAQTEEDSPVAETKPKTEKTEIKYDERDLEDLKRSLGVDRLQVVEKKEKKTKSQKEEIRMEKARKKRLLRKKKKK